MHKPCSSREEVFDLCALLAAMEEMSTVAELEEPEDTAVPHHDCSGAACRDTQHLLPLSYMCATAVNVLRGAKGGSV